MKRSYLQITYLRGQPLAAYYCTEQAEGGLLVDYSPDGRPIGIEIPSPSRFDLETLNTVLVRLGQDVVGTEDMAPLVAS